MKTNKKVWKIVSVVLALAMVVTMLPTSFLGSSVTVQAVSVGDEMFSSFSSTYQSVSADYDYDNSVSGWKWGANQSASGYSYGLSFIDWFMSSGTVTGYAYYTVPSMPAGTYTLTCEVDYINIGSTTSKTTVYPYIGGSQVTSYSISPKVSSTWSTSATVSNGSFSYSFTLDEKQTNYAVGFYVAITAQQEVHLNNWSLTCDALSVSYDLDSTSTVSGTTVATGTSTSDLQSALASNITVNSKSSDGESFSEDLALTWDLSNVNLDEAGDYEATYSYTSSYVGAGSGTVTISVVEIVSDQASKEIVTGTTTETVEKEKTETVDKTIEWGSSNVPGTFESGTLGTSTLTSNGFFVSSTSNVAFNTTYYHAGSKSLGIKISSNSGGGQNNSSSSSQSLKYGYGTSKGSFTSSSTVSVTCSSTSVSSSGWTNKSFTITPTTSGTYYLNFNVSSYYLYATLTNLTAGTTYTVDFYYAGYKSTSGRNSTYYVLIDDVTVSYTDTVTTTYEEEEEVPQYATVYYDYADSYTADTATVEVDASDADVASALPSYVTADLEITSEDAETYAEYLTDDDLTMTQAIPVEWDTSSVDTSEAGSYTVEGTATYNGEEYTVETKLNVVEMGTIISAAYTDDSYDIGCMEDYTQWNALGTTGDTYAIGDVATLTGDWISADTGTYAWSVWSGTAGNSMYLVAPSVVNGITAGTYTYSVKVVGEGLTVDVVGLSDGDDSTTATVLGNICTNVTTESGVWTEYSGSFTYSGSDITGTYPAIGLKVTIASSGGWGYVDTFNLSGPIYSGEVEEVEVLTIPDDATYAVKDSDFSSGWKVLNYATITSSDYSFGGYYSYLQNWYWDNTGYDSDDDDVVDTYYTEYDEASAYYRTPYNLTTGTYTMDMYIAGSGYTIYPMIYDGTTATVLYDYPYAVDSSADLTWDDATFAQVEFDLEEDYENVYVGVYIDTSTEGCWANVTGFSWYYGSAADQIWDDQPKNGDFEAGSIYPWLGDNLNDTSEDYLYGYTVNQDIDGVDGYSLNLWNNSEDTYDFTIYQNIKINTAGTYYFDYQAVGAIYSEDAVISAMVIDYEDGETIYSSSSDLEVPNSYYDWTEYIVGLDGVDHTTYIEDESDDAGFTVEEGTVITLIIAITLGQYDYLSLDNIKFVQEGYVAPEKTYIAVDQFENAGFDSPWAVAQYWTGTGDIDESDDAAYGYKIISAYEATGDEDEAEDDAVYIAWNNDTEESHEYTLSQQISVTETGKYNIKVDTRGWIYGTAVMTVTAEDGTQIIQTSVAPSSNDSWTTIETGSLSIEGDQVITVTVTISLDAATVGGSYEDDDGEEVEWYQESNIKLDNFVFEDYVQIEIAGDGSYTPVTWKSTDGYTYYVNGGNFIKGVDISSIISLEAAGTTFTSNVFEMLKDVGVNSIRIRIWNNPYDTSGNMYGGGTNNADVAAMIAERAADVGLSVFLSFHLSDFWADPSDQIVPKAWSSYSASQKASETYTFVKETVEKVQNTGADITVVSIGNETNAAYVAGTSSYADFGQIVCAGADAVRAVDTKIMTAIHVAPTGDTSSYGNLTWMAQYYSNNYTKNSCSNDSLDFFGHFDIFSSSCYPYWASHAGATNNYKTMMTQLNSIAKTYSVATMITEFNWPYELGSDQDGSGYVTVSTDSTNGGYTDSKYGYWNKWDVSRQGQADMIQEVVEYAAENVQDMIGTYYWEPAWISATNSVSSWSQTIVNNYWYKYGCGVATMEGASYLSWTGYDSTYNKAAGSKTDEYTLFNATGTAAASLAALGYSTDTLPIQEALAQVSSAVDNKCSLRLVGQVTLSSTSEYDSIGFKVEYCNSTGSKIITLADKDTTMLYSSIKANGVTTEATDGTYYYAYEYNKIPTTGTYYFKVITTAKGTASYQQSIKYYKLASGTLSTIDAWDYPGTNASLTSASYSTLYPSYIK